MDKFFSVMSVITIIISFLNLFGCYLINVEWFREYGNNWIAKIVGVASFSYNAWEVAYFSLLLATNMACLVFLRMKGVKQEREEERVATQAS